MELVSQVKCFVLGTKGQDRPLPEGPVDFEDAISATKFGKYNVFLMGFTILSSFAVIFDTTSMSYAVPSAECDLRISLLDKGLLNAIVHAGMICSAFFVGYLADTIGRKKVMLGGLLFDAVFNIFVMFSHNFLLTLLFKFLAGIFVCGTTVQVTMMAEFHAAKYRPPIVMFGGLTLSMAMLLIPLLAWATLANPFTLYIGSYGYHSWQAFLAICCLPATLGALWAFFIPESPKFLISRGRTDEALAVMRRMYVINTGKPADTFPVKELKSINDSEKESVTSDVTQSMEMGTKKRKGAMAAIMGGVNQLKPLFTSPHLSNMLLMFCIQFAGITGINSLRLWLPQLFKMMTDFVDENGSLCDMISLGNKTVVEIPLPENGICQPITVNPQTYINSIIVAGVQVVFCTIASLIINYVGKRRLLVTMLLGAGLGDLGIYWCANATQATALAALNIALTAVCNNAILSILVDLFPTSLRAMAVSLIMMVGRIGSITGNITFPILLAVGCLPPFLTLGCILIGGGLLSLLIPAPIKHDT